MPRDTRSATRARMVFDMHSRSSVTVATARLPYSSTLDGSSVYRSQDSLVLYGLVTFVSSKFIKPIKLEFTTVMSMSTG